MINLHIVIGYLGKDPELTYTPKQRKAKAVFSVATNETWKDKDGEPKEATEWHDIEVWGALAEACAQHLKKGSLVYVQGPRHTQRWEKGGVQKSRSVTHGKKIKFLPSNNG